MLNHALFFGQIHATVSGLSLLDVQTEEDFFFHLRDLTPPPSAMQTVQTISGSFLCKRLSYRKDADPHTPYLMADTVCSDWVHPTLPLLVRSFCTLYPITLQLCLPARTVCTPRRDLLPVCVLELSQAHRGVIARLALVGAVDFDESNAQLRLHNGNGHLLFCAEGNDSAVLRRAYRDLCACSISKLCHSTLFQEMQSDHRTLAWLADEGFSCDATQTFMKTLLQRIDENGIVRDRASRGFDALVQREVLQTLCAFAKPNNPILPLCCALADAFWKDGRLCAAVRRDGKKDVPLPHAAASYPLTVIALLHYESRFAPKQLQKHLPTYAAMLSKSAALLQDGLLPHCEEEGTPDLPSLANTVALHHAISSLGAYQRQFETEIPHLKKLQTIQASLSLHLPTVLPRFSVKRTVGYCDCCADRVPIVGLRKLFPSSNHAFLCKDCYRQGRVAHRREAAAPLFDHFGLLAPTLPDPTTLSFAQFARFCRLFGDRNQTRTALQRASEFAPNTLFTKTLCDLLLLSIR